MCLFCFVLFPIRGFRRQFQGPGVPLFMIWEYLDGKRWNDSCTGEKAHNSSFLQWHKGFLLFPSEGALLVLQLLDGRCGFPGAKPPPSPLESVLAGVAGPCGCTDFSLNTWLHMRHG